MTTVNNLVLTLPRPFFGQIHVEQGTSGSLNWTPRLLAQTPHSFPTIYLHPLATLRICEWRKGRPFFPKVWKLWRHWSHSFGSDIRILKTVRAVGRFLHGFMGNGDGKVRISEGRWIPHGDCSWQTYNMRHLFFRTDITWGILWGEIIANPVLYHNNLTVGMAVWRLQDGEAWHNLISHILTNTGSLCICCFSLLYCEYISMYLP